MKFLFDLLPVLLFFAAYQLAGANPEQSAAWARALLGPLVGDGTIPKGQAPILLATAVAIVASLAQVGWLLARRRKVEPMLWLSSILIVVFGGATIWLHDETFIKWKPSILYALFAALLAGGRLLYQRNFLHSLLGEKISLSPPLWDRLLWAWTGFFVVLAVLNLVVAYTTSTDIWVNFKLFGLMGLTFAFALGVGLWLVRHAPESPDA